VESLNLRSSEGSKLPFLAATFSVVPAASLSG